MKLQFSRRAYDSLDAESRAALKPVACGCIKIQDGEPDPNCEECEGIGAIYEQALSAEDSAAIQENFRRQGFPFGRTQ